MRKFLLVTLLGMVLAINLYGIVQEIVSFYESKHVEDTYKGYTTVYME